MSAECEFAGRPDRADENSPRVIPPHGGYRKLRSFQVAELVYDGTAIFCDRFVDPPSSDGLRRAGKPSRMVDQMVQAARSGRQNIAEGSMASATSKKTELKLTNVAKASLEELLLDYEDFLRQRGFQRWDKDSPAALAVRNRFRFDGSDKSDRSAISDPYGIAAASSETAANTLICLINQATYLLKRQLEKLEQSFLHEGGFTERLYQARQNIRHGGFNSRGKPRN